jgi:hypothetical protein
MAAIERKTRRYPTDLTDEEWLRIEPLLPRPSKRGRKPAVDLLEVPNAIRYMTRSGGGWRMLPKKLPTMADRLLVVSPLCPDDVVSHHP